MGIGEQFEELIAGGKIKFAPADASALTPWGRVVVNLYLGKAGIGWQLGDTKVGRSYCLKVDDHYLQYLDILEETQEFLWCTDDHHNSIHPDAASAYLIMKTLPGVRVTSRVDGDVRWMDAEVETPNGPIKFTVSDVQTMIGRIISIKQGM